MGVGLLKKGRGDRGRGFSLRNFERLRIGGLVGVRAHNFLEFGICRFILTYTSVGFGRVSRAVKYICLTGFTYPPTILPPTYHSAATTATIIFFVVYNKVRDGYKK